MTTARKPTPVPLPTRDGVGPSCVALPPGAWTTIDDFLAERFAAVPAQVWQGRMQRGELLDDFIDALVAQEQEESLARVMASGLAAGRSGAG